MTTPVYTVVIRGGTTPNNRISGSSTDGVYRVDWHSVLQQFEDPTRHRWKLTADFRSGLSTNYDILTDRYVFVECSAFTKSGFFDSKGNQSSALVAIAHANTIDIGSVYMYHRTENIFHTTVSFPTQETFSIKLTDITGDVLDKDNFTDWVLTLQLEKII